MGSVRKVCSATTAQRRLRPCLEPRCPILVESGYCEQHQTRKAWTPSQPRADRPIEPRLRGRANQRRRAALFAREPLCRECVKQGNVTKDSIATIRDHIIPLTEGGTETPDNEQPLCQTCSDIKTQQESARGVKRSFYGKTASVLREVVTGPSGAGKTTYVERHRAPGVIVWDLDKVADTVAQMPSYPRPPHISIACHAMRGALVAYLQENPSTPFLLIITEQADAERVAALLNARVTQLQ